jgi:hypothetical protein
MHAWECNMLGCRNPSAAPVMSHLTGENLLQYTFIHVHCAKKSTQVRICPFVPCFVHFDSSGLLYYALHVYPERQSDPAIYRKRGKFSKILSRWSYAEFNSAYSHCRTTVTDFWFFFFNIFIVKSHIYFRWISWVNIIGAQSKSLKILENPESWDRKFS